MKKLVLIIFLFCFSGFLTSCVSIFNFASPYLIENPHVEIYENQNMRNVVEMCFTLLNDSDKTITCFTISFSLYDSDENTSFVGSNCIAFKSFEKIESQEKADFRINLEPYISDIPNEPFMVDFVFLREISYSDGSTWKDPYGMYCSKENYEQ